MMSEEIQIVDRGRGPQLSSCRITVQDVFPYILQNFTREQILEIMPVLTDEELRVIEQYIREHRDEVEDRDRLIRERSAERRKPHDVEMAERQERLARIEAARQRIRRHIPERNGDSTPR